MKVDNAMNTAVNGIKRGLDGLERNADEVARASKGDGSDMVTPLVESKINQRQVEANVAMVKTMDEVLGTLLDEKA
jgi:hypothetical protein